MWSTLDRLSKKVLILRGLHSSEDHQKLKVKGVLIFRALLLLEFYKLSQSSDRPDLNFRQNSGPGWNSGIFEKLSQNFENFENFPKTFQNIRKFKPSQCQHSRCAYISQINARESTFELFFLFLVHYQIHIFYAKNMYIQVKKIFNMRIISRWER